MGVRPISVCDHCGTHARTLQACTRCRDVLYCNRDCQRAAWTTHHRTECETLRRRDQYVSGELWPPRPFAAVIGKVPLSYVTYLVVVNAFAESGPYERTTDAEFGAPPRAIELLRQIKCDVCTTLAAVRATFTRLTNRSLPTHSVLAWADLHAPPALAWRRDLADNDEAYVAIWRVAESRVVARDRRGKRVFRVALQACTCCPHEMCVLPVLNNGTCLEHEPAAFECDELRALDFLTPHSTLDVFTTLNLLTFTDTDSSTCTCLGVLTAESAVVHGNFLRVAAVRATFTRCIVDVLALIVYHQSATPHCSPILSLDSRLLSATTTLTA